MLFSFRFWRAIRAMRPARAELFSLRTILNSPRTKPPPLEYQFLFVLGRMQLKLHPQKSPVSAVEAGLFGWGREMKWRCVPHSRLWREFFVRKMLFEERLVLFFKPGFGHVVRAALFPVHHFPRRPDFSKSPWDLVWTTLEVGSAGVMLTIGTLTVRRVPSKPLAIVDEPVVFNVCQEIFE